MDPIDYQILDFLQRDARTTQAQIADAVGLSQPSVADRIRKLDRSGAILGYAARRDAHDHHHRPRHRQGDHGGSAPERRAGAAPAEGGRSMMKLARRMSGVQASAIREILK